VLPPGFRHLQLDETGSTNTECLELARAGEAGGLWVTARRQLSGRGSRGRNWVSEPGNLYSSLLLDAPWPLASLSQLTYVASLALRDALIEAAAPFSTLPDFRLKWPNDVLADGEKTAGILLESHAVGDRRIVICGIGTNVRHYPSETLHPATSLLEKGIDTEPEILFSRLARTFANRLLEWNSGDGFATTRRDWQDAAMGLGRKAKVVLPTRDGQRTIAGTLLGIDETGVMSMRREDGSVEKITTADIFFA